MHPFRKLATRILARPSPFGGDQHRPRQLAPRTAFIAFLLLASGLARTASAGETFTAYGFLAVRGGGFEGQRSWLQGGFGRLADGGATPESRTGHADAEGRLGLDWQPRPEWLLRVHLVGRAEPEAMAGRAVGLAEAWLQRTWTVGESGEVALRGGQLFLPTSLENRGTLWTSDSTLTLSALNSWVAEEVRPIGVDLRGSRDVAGLGRLSLAGTAFGGNDAAGALLAWRGWSLGGRLSTTGESLPLPPLASLGPGGAFAGQRADGTLPIDRDLDGRLGWSVRGRWTATGERFLVQAAWLDNRGDRALHRGEYAWRTRFGWLGGQVDLGHGLRLVGEAGRGDTGMGERTGGYVQADLAAGYLMLTWTRGPAKLALRWDRFEVVDRDHSAAEDNDESGRAWTLALLWRLGERWRLGGELLSLEAQRPAAAGSGFDPNTDGRSLLLEVRRLF